ncbi:MAG TPA: CaiB/BaiF CoA-transferase family protein, partial [Micromonosporaceae bacterium]
AAAPGANPAAATLGPLTGLVVVEVAGLVSVPYIGALLADLGAEVVKVEGPQRPDALRHSFGPFLDNDPGTEPWNRSGAFHMLNRGKRSLVCDMKSEPGRLIFRRLVERADVLIENFATGVLGKWGLSPQEAVRLNPRLIALSNTGFGASGPWAAYKAQGTTLEVTMGAAAYTGYPDGDPLKAGQSYPDYLACWSGLLAILAALAERDRTGRGQWIDQGMYQLGAAVIPEALLSVQVGQAPPLRRGGEDLDTFVSGIFATRQDGRWLALSIPDAVAARSLSPLVPALADAGEGCAEQVRSALARWLRQQDADAAEAVLVEVGVAAGRVLTARDLYGDEHLRQRQFFEPVEVDPAGQQRRLLIGRPFRFSRDPLAARVRGPAPDFGADNEYVLREIAGFAPDEVARLLGSPALTTTPRSFPAVRPIAFADLIEAGRFEAVDEPGPLVATPPGDGA